MVTEDAIVTNPAEEPKAGEVVENVQEQPSEQAPKENHEAIAQAEGEERKRRAPRVQPNYDEQIAKIKDAKEKDALIEVTVVERVRGGLRAAFDGMPVFLPSSHFTLRRNPSEEEFDKLIGNKIQVKVHEVQEEEGRKTVIVTRKPMLLEEFWGKINVGDTVEGPISSIASFGVFIDLGGIEGLIHISRLSQVHIDDPSKIYQKGQILSSVVTEINKETNRIALSRKELEDSPWKGVDERFPVDSIQEGVVRRLVDFGAYVELLPGIDGLLRNSELSYAKRVSHPQEVIKIGDTIKVKVISVSEEKRTVGLSLKQTMPNPWEDLFRKYPIGTSSNGIVTQVLNQGVIIRLGEEVDGFMPRSKMRSLARGKKIPFNIGDTIEVLVADINPAEESLILTLKNDDMFSKDDDREQMSSQNKGDTRIALGDMLSEEQMKKLYGEEGK